MKKLLLVLLFFSMAAECLELNLPVLYDKGVSPRTEEQRQASYVAYDVLKENNENVYRLHSLTNLGASDLWYVFSKIPMIYGVNISQGSLIGKWPLTRWPNEYLEKEVAETFIYGTEWSELLSPPVDFMGCMQRAPLRYGDITGDGTPELVVLLSSGYSVDWNVFSTGKNKIIFSSKLNFTDAVKTEDVPAYLIPSAADKQYQFWLKSGVEEEKGAAMQPALKAYGKLYLGDFDNDESHDIVVWRKLYISRLRNDPTAGFQHVRDTLLHYKLTEGEYQPQETEEATIKSWLTSRQFTWSGGYPSQSECPGQENQLIPEMHDPLLNDPEVLQ